MLTKIERKDSKSDRSNTPDSVNVSDYDVNEPSRDGALSKKRLSLYATALRRTETGGGANSPGLINRVIGKYCTSGVSTPLSYASDNE